MSTTEYVGLIIHMGLNYAGFSPFFQARNAQGGAHEIILFGLALLFTLPAVAQARTSEHHLSIVRQAAP